MGYNLLPSINRHYLLLVGWTTPYQATSLGPQVLPCPPLRPKDAIVVRIVCDEKGDSHLPYSYGQNIMAAIIVLDNDCRHLYCFTLRLGLGQASKHPLLCLFG